MKLIKIKVLCIGMLFFGASVSGLAQTDTNDLWDSQMYLSNRFAWTKKNWRYSGEFQVRLNNNTKSLDQYFIEGVATFMPSKHWEIVPDLRFTVHPDKYEIRPGIGTIFKQYWGKEAHKNQLAHQFKYQMDLEDGGIFKHGFRYILFHNVVLNDKFLISSAAGGFYRWSDKFTGVQFGRAMSGLAFSFDKKHIVSISYFVGAENQGEYWSYIGGPIIQLVIRFDDNFKYVPAKYISF